MATGAAVVFLPLTVLFTGARSVGRQNLPIPADRLLSDAELLTLLRPHIPALAEIYRLRDRGDTLRALQKLAVYLKNRARVRYYFDWGEVPKRLEEYRRLYPKAVQEHLRLAREQLNTFPPEPPWKLPFRDLHGKEMTPYRLRHLARQQKAPDLAFAYYLSGKNPKFLRYFVRQVASLNRAFAAGEYEQGGNDVYERFRAGKRVHNWLFAHHLFLADSAYTWKDQILLIKTFLHHGAQLFRRTRNFSRGNHHTMGLVGLFQIAVLFREFQGTGRWRDQALHGILQHLRREVNEDGFQFERSVHYHIGDIDNYFRVFLLARHNGVSLPEEFTPRFRSMFDALVKLAQPNGTLPVLQDCTDRPYAEEVLMNRPMALGALLFSDPVYRYFAGSQVPPDLFWYFPRREIRNFSRLPAKAPDLGSLALTETGYYVMRNGWDPAASTYLVIDAGLCRAKPDHQQAGALGLVAFAGGHQVLPNYQVSYSHPDFLFWKSSWAKNVALVDSLPLGRGWQPNRGRSGFGKWRFLAAPEVLSWISRREFTYFAGTHDGYDSLGVEFVRTVLFVRDGFWIVRDRFAAPGAHTYQQVWQGKFSRLQGSRNIFEQRFDDGSGLLLIQLSGRPESWHSGSRRGKHNLVLCSPRRKKFAYLTLFAPYTGPQARPRRLAAGDHLELSGWKIISGRAAAENPWPELQLHRGREVFRLGTRRLCWKGDQLHLEEPADLFIREEDGRMLVTVLFPAVQAEAIAAPEQLRVNGKELRGKSFRLSPGDTVEILP